MQEEMLKDKYFFDEVFDVAVFDDSGEFVTELDSAKKASLFYSEDDECYILHIKEALLDMKLLKFIGKVETRTDIQKYLEGKTKLTISKKSSPVQCKIIGKTIFYDPETMLPEDAIFEFFGVEIASHFSLEGSHEKHTPFDCVFKIKGSENGDFFSIHV